jgi:CBS domain-containing protein
MTPRSGVPRSSSLVETAQRMLSEGVAAVPVVTEEGEFVGMVTNRDMVEQIARARDPHETHAADAAQPRATVQLDTSLDAVSDALADQLDGRLPVLDGRRFAGLVTERDVEAAARLRNEFGVDLRELLSDVSPQDPTAGPHRSAHLLAGFSALDCLRRALAAAGKQDVERLLDVPCGHGRIMRILNLGFPNAELGACDVDGAGVDYCARVFGAAPFYSDPDPGRVKIDREYDLIWCGSLFTHLDAHRWPGFLALLESTLSPGGLLVFTTHGRRDKRVLRSFGLTKAQAESILADVDRSGFGYVDYEGQPNWGLAIAPPDWVEAQIIEHTSLLVIGYEDHAWDAPRPHQDAFWCVPMG